MAKSRFVYRGGERNSADVHRRAKQSGGTYDSFLVPDIQTFKAKEGEVTVRILPATWEDQDKWGPSWEIGIYLHYSVGPDNQAYLCLDKMKGESCPVCEAKRDAVDEDEMKALTPSWRALCWVIDRDNEKAGPMLWSMPITLFREIHARSEDKKTGEILYIDNPEEGYDITFDREGTDKRTKYKAVEIDREATPLHDNEKTMAKWLDYITEHPLPDVLNFYDGDHIEKVLFGKGKPKDEDEDDSRSRRSSRRKTEEDDEDEKPKRKGKPWKDEDEEEEEDEKPRSRRAKEPEPEEEETEEEEEEVKPRHRRAAKEEEPEEEEAEEETEEEDEEEEKPSASARRKLRNLKKSK